MANRVQNESEVENFEKRKEQMRDESSSAHHDGSEFPSSDDVLRARGEGAADRTEAPEKDEVASDSEADPSELHGSLHGRWTKTDQ
jgi:hypothetical protein